MSIGDVNSPERGSGARFNGGKVRLDYVPARVLADFYMITEPRTLTNSGMIELLNVIACFEERVGGPELTLLARALNLTLPIVGGIERFRATADVFDFGAGKYAPWNWAKGMAWSIPLACIKRHAVKIIEGETNDEESGLDHRGHIGCNIVMLMHYVHNFREGDDRPSAECFARSTAVPAVDIVRNALPGDPQFMGVDPETGDGRCNDPSCLCHAKPVTGNLYKNGELIATGLKPGDVVVDKIDSDSMSGYVYRTSEIDHELRPIPGPRSIDQQQIPCKECGQWPCIMAQLNR